MSYNAMQSDFISSNNRLEILLCPKDQNKIVFRFEFFINYQQQQQQQNESLG
jgi:hypothetical protein